jgi:hypothetical protein
VLIAGSSARPDQRDTAAVAASTPPAASNMTAANPTAAKRAASETSSPASPAGEPLPSNRSNAHSTARRTPSGSRICRASAAPTSPSAGADSCTILGTLGARSSTRTFSLP